MDDAMVWLVWGVIVAGLGYVLVWPHARRLVAARGNSSHGMGARRSADPEHEAARLPSIEDEDEPDTGTRILLREELLEGAGGAGFPQSPTETVSLPGGVRTHTMAKPEPVFTRRPPRPMAAPSATAPAPAPPPPPARRGGGAGEAMRVVISLAVLGSALYVVLSQDFGESQENWAFGVIGLLIGHWMPVSPASA